MADTTEYNTPAAWDRIARDYDRTNTPTQMWLGGEGVRRAGLRPGMRFLDVAAGSGALSIPAARLGAHVVAVDQSSAMLELLVARARNEQLSVETRVMDGHALDLPDNSFDMAGSQFGVMVFPDMPRAIHEMVRVTRPGGRVLVLAYGDPEQIDFLAFLVGAIQSVRPDFHGPPAEAPPREFQLADPARLRRELTDAGLNEVTVDTIVESTDFDSGGALWDWIVFSNPIVERVLGPLGLSASDIDTVKQALEKMVRERAGDGPSATLTNPVNIGIGVK